MKFMSLIQHVVVRCCVLLSCVLIHDVAGVGDVGGSGSRVGAAEPERASEREPASAARVEFIIGDYMAEEGGSWEPASSAVQGPFGIDFDQDNVMYIVELTSGRVLSRATNGDVTALSEHDKAGYSGDGGPLSDAYFNGPHNCVVSRDQALLVADSWNHCVRRVDLKTLQVRTSVGTGQAGFSGDEGLATAATFHDVMCIELDPARRTLHVADLKNLRVRNVDLETGIVRTVAGNGKRGVPRDGDRAVDAPLVDPRAAASDADGRLYVLERNGHALRVVELDGTIRTVAGSGKKGFRDGVALEAEFGSPKHLCCAPDGNVYIADDLNGAIRKYDPRTQQVTTLLGRGHGDSRIQLEHPHGVRWHAGSLYALDTAHNRIFRIGVRDE